MKLTDVQKRAIDEIATGSFHGGSTNMTASVLEKHGLAKYEYKDIRTSYFGKWKLTEKGAEIAVSQQAARAAFSARFNAASKGSNA